MGKRGDKGVSSPLDDAIVKDPSNMAMHGWELEFGPDGDGYWTSKTCNDYITTSHFIRVLADEPAKISWNARNEFPLAKIIVEGFHERYLEVYQHMRPGKMAHTTVGTKSQMQMVYAELVLGKLVDWTSVRTRNTASVHRGTRDIPTRVPWLQRIQEGANVDVPSPHVEEGATVIGDQVQSPEHSTFTAHSGGANSVLFVAEDFIDPIDQVVVEDMEALVCESSEPNLDPRCKRKAVWEEDQSDEDVRKKALLGVANEEDLHMIIRDLEAQLEQARREKVIHQETQSNLEKARMNFKEVKVFHKGLMAEKAQLEDRMARVIAWIQWHKGINRDACAIGECDPTRPEPPFLVVEGEQCEPLSVQERLDFGITEPFQIAPTAISTDDYGGASSSGLRNVDS